MAERDPRYFKVYQDGDDRELEQKIQQIVESGAAPGIDMVARENIEEIQRKIDNGEIGGGGGDAGVDNVARQEIQEVSAQLEQTAKKLTVMDRLPETLTDFVENALVATPEKSIPISWNVADWQQGSLASSNGNPFAGVIRIRPLNYMPAVSSGKYVVFTKPDTLLSIFEFKEDNTFIKSSGWLANEALITLDAQTTKIKMLVRHTRENHTITADFIQTAQPIMSRVY